MNTQTPILMAAEPLIAHQGPEGISMREIARLSGQRNTAALQYHFGSREGLLDHWVLWRIRQINRLRDRHFGPLQASPSLESLIVRLAQPFLMHLKSTFAQHNQSHWARCLARLDMAGALTPPEQPADQRWQNSLLTTLAAIREQLPTEHAEFLINLAFHTLAQGLSRIEHGISDTSLPLESLHPRGDTLQAAITGMLRSAIINTGSNT